MKLSEHSSNS